MKLDLRYKKSKLSPSISVLFNEIAKSKKDSFTILVSKVSKPFKHNLDWWVDGPASRNTHLSPFFHYYCAIYLVDELVRKKHEISEIIVDSPAFAKILKKYLNIHEKSIHVENAENTLIYYLKAIVKSALNILNRSYQFKCAKQTKSLQKSIPDRALTLIESVILPRYISKDRYYNGLWENLVNEQKETTFFVSTLLGIPIKDVKSAYKELRSADRNFIIKEDYLKLKDLLFAINHYFRIQKIKVKPVKVLGVDISSLIKEELRLMRGYSSAIEALLNYRFVQRISESKMKLRLVIDWWENQVVDKGWNAGFNRFYPQTQTIGYLGYAPRLLELQLYPTESENQNCVLPKKIATIGEGFVEPAKMYYRNLDVINVPAFRFQHVWNENVDKEESDADPFTIFVALSIFAEESFDLLRMVKDSINKMDLAELRFWIKPHPTMSEEKLKNGFGEKWPEEFIVVSGDSSDYLHKTDVLISGTSSICLETLALGIPVIVADNLSGLKYNPIPQGVSQKMWRFCKTPDEIVDAIKFYKGRNSKQIEEYTKIAVQVRRDYFEPVTRDGINKFLLLN